MRSEALQKKLLTVADLTIKRAQEIAQSMESADLNAKDLKGDATLRVPTDSVNLTTSSSSTSSHKKFGPCHCCGRHHDAKTCKFKEATCHKCGKQGHIATVCRFASPPSDDKGKKRYNNKPYHKRRAGGIMWLEADEEDKEALPLFVLQGDVPQPPILINMSLNGSPVHFELDTGAAVTVMSEQKFRQFFPDQHLE